MTANGWLQILLFLLVTFAVAKPLGVFMTRVFCARENLSGSLAASLGAIDLPGDGGGRTAGDALDGIYDGDAAFQRGFHAVLYAMERVQQWTAVESGEAGRGADGPGVQYGGIVYDQHELADVRRRIDDELFHADGGTGLSQLHVRSGGHCAGDRSDSRNRAARQRNHREFLGGLDANAFCGCCCRRAWWLRWCLCRRA